MKKFLFIIMALFFSGCAAEGRNGMEVVETQTYIVPEGEVVEVIIKIDEDNFVVGELESIEEMLDGLAKVCFRDGGCYYVPKEQVLREE